MEKYYKASEVNAIIEKLMKEPGYQHEYEVTGHSEGVKMGGKLLVSSRKLRVSAMMNNLPDILEVDSTHLMIGKQIVAGDLNFEGVTIVSPKATIICSVRPTRATQQAKMEQQSTGKKK